MATLTLKVEGMHCGGCTSRVKKSLLSLPGVKSAEAHLEAKEVVVDFEAAKVGQPEIVEVITDLGFDVTGS